MRAAHDGEGIPCLAFLNLICIAYPLSLAALDSSPRGGSQGDALIAPRLMICGLRAAYDAATTFFYEPLPVGL